MHQEEPRCEKCGETIRGAIVAIRWHTFHRHCEPSPSERIKLDQEDLANHWKKVGGPMPVILTFGYHGHTIDAFESKVRELGAKVFDIRFSTNSRFPQWRFPCILDRLRGRYQWVRDWGNIHYKLGGGEIVLSNWEEGLKSLVIQITAHPEQPVILMCACSRYETCHRKVVADRLIALGYSVQELELDDGRHLEEPL